MIRVGCFDEKDPGELSFDAM